MNDDNGDETIWWSSRFTSLLEFIRSKAHFLKAPNSPIKVKLFITKANDGVDHPYTQFISTKYM